MADAKDQYVSLTSAGHAAVTSIVDRALEVDCPECDARSGHTCGGQPTGVHWERVQASFPLKIACPGCGAPKGMACFEPGGRICVERTQAYEKVCR